MSYIENLTLRQWVDDISSDSPVPGGGAVAALNASLASALCTMAANLTVGRKFYNEYDEDVKEKIRRVIDEAQVLKDRFLRLVEEDMEAFNQVMAAYRLPKESEEEKKIRSLKIQEGLINAVRVPLEVSRNLAGMFEYVKTLCIYGNPNCITDAGVGALQAMAALEGAVLNVRINLASIKDEEFVNKAKIECNALLMLGKREKDAVMDIVNAKLGV